MNHKEHAERLLREITQDGLDVAPAASNAARAQVHATLHLAEVVGAAASRPRDLEPSAVTAVVQPRGEE